MARQIVTSDDAILVEEIAESVSNLAIAKFEDSGNGMEGGIFEGDNARMEASDLIAVARWLLNKAEERARTVELA